MSSRTNRKSKSGIEDIRSLSVPEGWQLRRLKTLASIHPSNIDKKSQDDEVPIQLCNYTDVYYNDEIVEDIDFMSATADRSKIRKFRLREGDILATKDSESKDDIGVTAQVKQDFEDVVCGYHLFLFRPHRRVVDPEFLFWALNSQFVLSQFEMLANGVTRYGLTTQNASEILIPLPPKRNQNKISEYISNSVNNIDYLSEKYNELTERFHQKIEAVVRTAATEGLDTNATLVDSGVDWLGEVPAHWDIVRTRFVARLESGHTPSRSNEEYWENTDIPWVTTSDIKPFRKGRKIYLHETEHQISELGLENSGARLLPEDTVFLSRTASVGFSGIMGREMATSQDFANWVCGDEIIPEYLLYVFRSMDQEFDRLTQGSTHQTIYMPDIRSFKTPLPPVEEQREIVQHIQTERNRLWKLIDKVDQMMDLLEEKRQSLITGAVTGQIDVTEEQDTDQEVPA